MIRKILIGAVIALILVPAAVLAAGFGGNGTSPASGQGPCLNDGLNCNQTGQHASGTGEQYRYGMLQGKEIGSHGDGDCECTGEGNKTRSMLRHHDGSRGAGRTSV